MVDSKECVNFAPEFKIKAYDRRKKFRKELGEKAIEHAKSHSSDEEEQKSLALAYIAGANDYAWMTLDSIGISKEDYKNIQSFLNFI